MLDNMAKGIRLGIIRLYQRINPFSVAINIRLIEKYMS